MLSSITIENFKSYKKATMQLAPLSLLIGANASGKSNALEAIRLLSWLARGSRMDDIERNIKGADSLVRGQAGDLFREADKEARIGCHISKPCENWNWLTLGISIIDEHLVIGSEQVANLDGTSLYKVDDTPHAHTDEISVMYNNFSQGSLNPHIPCSNRQAIFYQLE